MEAKIEQLAKEVESLRARVRALEVTVLGAVHVEEERPRG